MSIGILASRFVGLARQKIVAHYLGTSDAADAIAVGFRIGNITQNLLGEGSLSASFVPVYARLRLAGGDRAARFARAVLGIMIAVVTTASLALALAAPVAVAVIAPGFDGAKKTLTTELVRILFPMTGVLVLGAWALGVLTAHRRFLAGYLAPVIWSLAQIAAVLVAATLLGKRGADLAIAVAWGAFAGAGLQLLMMLLPVKTVLGSIAPTWEPRAEGVAESLSRFPGALLGRGVIQLSGLVDTLLVSLLGPGANSAFQYAQTLYLLPMSVLGTGEAAASLPDLAEHGENSEEARGRALRTLTQSLTRVLALSAGVSAIFVAFGVEVTTIPLRGGQFDGSSTSAVAAILAAYAAGLPANAASRILGVACFARGDTRRPAIYAGIRVVVSTLVSLALMQRFGVPGVVGGAAVAAWVELVLLARNVRATWGATGFAGIPFAKIAATAAAPLVVGVPIQLGLRHLGVGPFVSSAVVLGAAGAAFVAGAHVTKLFSLRSLLRRR